MRVTYSARIAVAEGKSVRREKIRPAIVYGFWLEDMWGDV